MGAFRFEFLMPQRTYHSVAAQAQLVISRTAEAWTVPPASAHAIARRAAYGHVPRCALRRLQAMAALRPAVLMHSW